MKELVATWGAVLFAVLGFSIGWWLSRATLGRLRVFRERSLPPIRCPSKSPATGKRCLLAYQHEGTHWSFGVTWTNPG